MQTDVVQEKPSVLFLHSFNVKMSPIFDKTAATGASMPVPLVAASSGFLYSFFVFVGGFS